MTADTIELECALESITLEDNPPLTEKEKVAIRNKKYFMTENGKKKRYEAAKRYRAKHPELGENIYAKYQENIKRTSYEWWIKNKERILAYKRAKYHEKKMLKQQAATTV